MSETFEAETTWLSHAGRLYVSADDLIAVLHEGGYHELADDFERVASDEAQSRAAVALETRPLDERGAEHLGSAP